MAEEQKTQQDLKLIENFVSALTIEVDIQEFDGKQIVNVKILDRVFH